MSSDLALTPLNWDLTVKDGKLKTIAKGPEIAQRVGIRLKRQQGEWFLDTSLGLPWYSGLLGSKDVATAQLLIRREIMTTDGVNTLPVFNAHWDSFQRSLSLFASIVTIYGTTETLSAVQGA